MVSLDVRPSRGFQAGQKAHLERRNGTADCISGRTWAMTVGSRRARKVLLSCETVRARGRGEAMRGEGGRVGLGRS